MKLESVGSLSVFWRKFLICVIWLHVHSRFASTVAQDSTADSLPDQVRAGLKSATMYFRDHVAVRGGYVYEYTPDLKTRLGEGKASPTEVWVQPPGTPAVGTAFLMAYGATQDALYLDAATDAGKALMFGQLESGGWSASIEFDPSGKNADRYRNGLGKAKGRNYSTLDDDKSQSAIRFLIQLDSAHQFQNKDLHESVQFALKSLLKAQFPNGGFPQGWKAAVADQPVIRATYPDYDWRTENRVKDYWDLYTLNDGLAGTVTETLLLAHSTYGEPAYLEAVRRFGDFLILAQMPEPQPVWAQQYSLQMHPAWARRFEPPAVVSSESADVIRTLIRIYEVTGEEKYLQPIPAALDWFRRSALDQGERWEMARFYELQTNRPLYFTKDTYELTYDDGDLPTHYGFKVRVDADQLEQSLVDARSGGGKRKKSPNLRKLASNAELILRHLDADGRWITNKDGQPLEDSDKASEDGRILSRVFIRNVEQLSEYLLATSH